MPKKAAELSALAVNRLTRHGLHAVGGVAGLLLQVSDTGARSWILRADDRRPLGAATSVWVVSLTSPWPQRATRRVSYASRYGRALIRSNTAKPPERR